MDRLCRILAELIPMPKRFSTIQKVGFGFAAVFLGVYLLDYVPGVMDENGLMFGLYHMSKLIDLGHLAAGSLALICSLISPKAARFYFWFLANLPHIIIFIAAYWVAINVDKPKAGAQAA